ncbi:hypothetical protein OMP38_32485 [Cohnella ginsengisoli]|uniref:Uncharacterized protein n=1 Tax=Cohnella ginsengisoli TaxID=425004 RepID=A0A9X4QQX1_9BACL|nr:hypothetical protein [Cohnella ginsengisoli]MDG0795022.1 hypothetical protein [Cohnella ginsengisoli]
MATSQSAGLPNCVGHAARRCERRVCGNRVREREQQLGVYGGRRQHRRHRDRIVERAGGGADNDYFAFSAASGGTVSVTFSSDGGTSEVVNQYISIIDATTSTTLATGSISPASPQRTISFSKTAGHTYHVVLIKPTGSAALYGYHLAIS